ncbi:MULTISPECIES: hypothetical protein [unclassified Bartonella]|uniref:hypothetical protein n=1 Tax=unclassified Bartonella TaxID=2645622 RepID=UPI0035CF81FD
MPEGVVHVGVSPCWGACVEGGCQRVCFSLSFSEMALLVFVCQEHGKWCLEKRRKGVKEGRGGYACFEGVVHVGVLLGCLVLGCLWMSLCGENAFVMRAKWSMLTRFAV